MQTLHIRFKVGTKEQVDNLFHGLFGSVDPGDLFRIVGKDYSLGGVTTLSGSYIWGPRKIMADWIILDNQGRIVGGIRFSDTPRFKYLTFDFSDQSKTGIFQLIADIIKEMENAGFQYVEQVEVSKQEDILNIARESDEIIEETESKPWEEIPEKNWDRQALEMWWEGYDRKSIASAVGINSDRRVTNRLSFLRERYGTNIVPYDKDRRVMQIKRI